MPAKVQWSDLNERQQTYLTVLYDADQAAEQARAREGARGRWNHTPAQVWRRIHFNDPLGPVVSRLRSAGVYETGAGATLSALRERGLVELQHVPGLLGGMLVYVWVTKAGRALVRARDDATPVRRAKPGWALSEWLWRELAKVAAAGPEGLRADELYGQAHLYIVEGYQRRGNRPYLASVRTWRTYRPRDPWTGKEWTSTTSTPVYRYQFTADGREHYRTNLARYRELYPDVGAVDLDEDQADEATPAT